MRKFITALLLFFLLPSTSFACSLVKSPEFHLLSIRQKTSVPPNFSVRYIRFVPWISGSGTCDGVGFIAIELSGLSTHEIKSHGFIIRAISGVNDKGLFPAFPLVPELTDNKNAMISWAWTGISPDPDGHVRWTLEIIPVSRSGVLGTPVSVCAASDDSCPELPGDGA